MADRPSFEEALRVLGESVADLSRRVSALERAAGALAPPEPVPALSAQAGVAPAHDLVGVLSLAGRTLIVFGGAYLLRALTESGGVPPGAGVALGLAYAVAWYAAADRAAGASRPMSSLFHGATAVLISLPLVWEAATHFHFLSPGASAAAVALLTGIALVVGRRRHLPGLAAVALVAGALTSVALAIATTSFFPFGAALVAIGTVTLWQSDERGWRWLRWPAALAADGVLIAMWIRSSVTPPVERPDVTMLLCILMWAAYAGSFAVLLLLRERRAGPFEFLQMAAALIVGLDAAASIARLHSAGALWVLGVLATGAGVFAYVVAFRLARRSEPVPVNFYFFGSFALVLLLWSAMIFISGPALPVTLAIASTVAAWLASRHGEPVGLLHAAVFVAASMLTAGLLSELKAVWLFGGPAWTHVSITGWIALAAAAFNLGTKPHAVRAADEIFDIVARILLSAMAVTVGGTAIVIVTGPIIAGVPPAIGVLASLKTVVVALGAVLLARASRITRLADAGWLAYPLLGFGAIKLFVEDFRYSQPSTLFIALAVYGAALILVPRLGVRS